MTSVAGILHREFRRLAIETKEDFSLLATQAGFLGKSVGHLSRVRTGRARLTRALATTIAQKLRPDAVEAQDALIEELMRFADDAVSSDPVRERGAGIAQQIETFFGNLHTDRAIVCIEYRDLPRTGPGSRYPKLVDPAITAIRAGLSVALFQPFGPPAATEPNRRRSYAPPALAGYLEMLRSHVREVYQRMYSEAVEADPEVGTRFVLYELDAGASATVGLQSRLFYVENHSQEPVVYEMWNWVAAVNGEDAFVQRDPEAITTSAVAAQFEPVLDYWRTHWKLPHTNALLDDAFETYRDRRADLSKDDREAMTSPWSLAYER